MNRLLEKPLHAAIIIILCGVGALYWYALQQQQRYDVAATDYLRHALTAIGTWEVAPLRAELAPAAVAAVDQAQLNALVERYRPLGSFTKIDVPQFGKLTAALSLFGGNTLLSYHTQAYFQRGNVPLTAL